MGESQSRSSVADITDPAKMQDTCQEGKRKDAYGTRHKGAGLAGSWDLFIVG